MCSPDSDNGSSAGVTRQRRALTLNADPRRLRRNVVSSYAAFVVQLALGLLVTPVLLRSLGASGFGLFTLVTSLAAYIGIAELGIGTATVRFVAAAGAENDELEMRRVLGTSRGLYLAISAVGLLVLVALLALLPGLGAESELGTARLGLLAVGLAQTLILAMNVYPALLFGTGRSSVLTTVGVVGVIVGAVGQIVVASVTRNVLATLIAVSLTTAASALATRVVAKRAVPDVRVRLRDFRRPLVKVLVSAGGRNALIALAATAAFATDTMIVSSVVSLTAVASYGVAGRAANVVLNLSTRISDVLVPTYAHFGKTNEHQQMYKIYRDSVTAGLLVTLPVAVLVFTSGQQLLELWLGSAPAGASSILQISIATIVVGVPGGNAFRLLSGINRLGFVVVAASIAALANLSLSIWLAFQIGASGPALGTLITMLVYDGVVMPTYVCRILTTPTQRLRRDLAWLLAPATAAGCVGVGVSSLGSSTGDVALRCAFSLLAYGLVVPLAAGGDRRQRYSGFLRRSTLPPSESA